MGMVIIVETIMIMVMGDNCGDDDVMMITEFKH